MRVAVGAAGWKFGWRRCGRRWWVGDGFYGEDVAGGDVDVVVDGGVAAEEEADGVAALGLVAGAVELGAIAQGDVLAGTGQRRGEEQGRGGEERGAPEGAEDHEVHGISLPEEVGLSMTRLG